MSQPGIPASGAAPTGLQAQNGAASASGSPYANGPVQNALMSSQVSVNQGYNSQLPGSYPHLMPAKTLNPVSGQSNYGGSQGSGQTFNRPPVASHPVTPSRHSGPVPRVPLPASQNPAATPMPSGSFLPGANLSPPLNWQYNYPSTGSQTNHCPRTSSQLTVSGNTSLTTNHQYAASGDPSLQNSFVKSGYAAPLPNPPLPTTFQPGAPYVPLLQLEALLQYGYPRNHHRELYRSLRLIQLSTKKVLHQILIMEQRWSTVIMMKSREVASWQHHRLQIKIPK